MIGQILRQYEFNLAFARELVADLSDEQMTAVPCTGFENHPAFTLGHLVTGSAMMIEDLGGEYKIPEGWNTLFLRTGPGDPRLPPADKNIYPAKSILLKELFIQHENVKSILTKTSQEKLSENIEWRFSSFMPTVMDLVTFMCINHEAMHLGQLSAWRRAMKLPSGLARLPR